MANSLEQVAYLPLIAPRFGAGAPWGPYIGACFLSPLLLASAKGGGLYRAPDHVLNAELSGCREQYRRFYFTDIQAIMIRNTDQGIYLTIVMVIIALFWIMMTIFAHGVWGVWVAFCMVAIFRNVQLGATCELFIRTAIQTTQVRTIVRLSQAHQALNALQIEVERIQGTYTPVVELPPTAEDTTELQPQTQLPYASRSALPDREPVFPEDSGQAASGPDIPQQEIT